MNILDFEHVLCHIRLNYYDCFTMDRVRQLKISFRQDSVSGLIIHVYDEEECESQDFIFNEMLKEIKKDEEEWEFEE